MLNGVTTYPLLDGVPTPQQPRLVEYSARNFYVHYPAGSSKTLVVFWGAWRMTFGYSLPLHSTLYTLHPTLYTIHSTPYTRKIALQGNFSCTYQKKALLLRQNILSQLWNTNLVLAVVLHLFVSTRIPLSANVQAWNSLLLLVLIWQCNTLTNASAANASSN